MIRLCSYLTRIPPKHILWAYCLATLVYTLVMAAGFIPHTLFQNLIVLNLLFSLIGLPIVYVFLAVRAWKKGGKTISDLVRIYFQSMLLFAVMYFVLATVPVKTTSAMRGLDSPFREATEFWPTLASAATTFVDCVYFSIVTSTTLGYGDMTPMTMFLKLVVCVQVVGSVYLGSVVLARVTQSRESETSSSTH